MASSRVLSGSVYHLSVASEERLHRSRKHGTPDVLLRVRQEAEEQEQAVSRVQAAHPVRRLNLPQLEHPRITSSISRVPSVSTIMTRRGSVQQDRQYKGTTWLNIPNAKLKAANPFIQTHFKNIQTSEQEVGKMLILAPLHNYQTSVALRPFVRTLSLALGVWQSIQEAGII